MASPRTIYRAFLDPAALASWLPPKGMKGRICGFDPREGGTYHMTLTYDEPAHSAPGKASEHSDVVRGRFLELVRMSESCNSFISSPRIQRLAVR